MALRETHRIALISDIHGNEIALREVLRSIARLGADEIVCLGDVATSIDLPLGVSGRLKLYHGSPSSNMVDLLADTPSEEFDRQLGPARATVMAGGHTHVQMVRQHRGVWVLNPGSVGAPFRESIHHGAPTILAHAEYAIVSVRGDDVGIELQRVGLDRRELAEAALASANPMRAALAAHYL